jgi:hypothetical protein
MAVIINELEVVLEAPSASAPAAAAAAAPQAAQQIQPLDIADIIERETRAEYRLLAH